MKSLISLVSTAFAVALFAPLSGQTQTPITTITPGPTLVIDGIPPIPATIAEDARRYTESRAANLASWHPTRREMLISTRFGNAPQIHQVKAPGAARTQLTFFDEPITSASYEPAAGRYFIFPKDVGGDEFNQLYRFDLQTGAITLLTDGGRTQNGGVVWSTRGDRIAYGSTRRNRTDRDIWIMNPADSKADRMLLELAGGGWQALDWSRDDTELLLLEYLSASHTRLWIADVATGQKTLLTAANDTVAYGDARFSPDGRGVYLTSGKDGEFQWLGYFDRATKAITWLATDIQWDVDRLEVSRDGKTIAFVANEAGASKLYFMDIGSRRIRTVGGVPAGVIGRMAWRRNAAEIGLSMSSARSSADVYSVDAESGKVERWTESELGGLVASELSEPELIHWTSFDGREISGFYYRPPARFTGKRPVIINIHGGPEDQFRPVYLGRNNYYLNELGAAIIFPNVRGSNGYGKTFLSLDNGMKREDSVKDIGALLDWITKRPDLDAQRIMVTGGSYGGYMTLAVATRYNDRIRSAVDVVGISNFRTFLNNTESYRRDLRRAEYGDERDPAMAAFFDRTAPLNNAQAISKPLFVVQGGNDPRVPRTEAEQMVARVKQNGSPVWYLMATDEGHGFIKKQNLDFQFYATVAFVKNYLVGDTRAGTTAR